VSGKDIIRLGTNPIADTKWRQHIVGAGTGLPVGQSEFKISDCKFQRESKNKDMTYAKIRIRTGTAPKFSL
jgi:hypothetical protein